MAKGTAHIRMTKAGKIFEAHLYFGAECHGNLGVFGSVEAAKAHFKIEYPSLEVL